MKSATSLRDEVRSILEKIVQRKRNILLDISTEKISKWLDNDPEFMKEPFAANRLFPLSSFIHTWTIKKYLIDVLMEEEDKKWLYLAQQSQSIHFRCAAALRRADPDAENFSLNLFKYTNLLSRTITLGRRDEAEFLARVGFNDIDGVLNAGISVITPLPWFVLELVKDWLGAGNVNLMTPFREVEVEGLGPWQALLEGWREPHLGKFGQLMYDLAERHVAQSKESDFDAPKYRDQRFDVEEPAYWIWPIELLAVLRLREWEGLPNPIMRHPLFSITPLGQLAPPLDHKTDPLLDAAFARFSAEHPLMMTMEDLPELREKQGYR